MFLIPTFQKIHQVIIQEIRNQTGLSITPDSDASIRADGTAAAVEGLYQHQNYIQRQLFIQTADEPYLYVHAEELGLPRIGGTIASGRVLAIANITTIIPAGTKITNGKGYYWSVVNDTELKANIKTSVDVVADRKGASWNYSGTLLWVSPPAGVSGTATEVNIGGGSDVEELEAWRLRLLERKQLGISRDREEDLINDLKAISGVQDVYVYPKRRGLGSLDAAITAVGTPPTLPSAALLAEAQTVLNAYTGFWADSKAYAPTEQLVPVSAVVSGNVNLESVRQVIRNYFAEIAPVETYQAAVLSARIISVAGVTDVVLTPSNNIVPTVDPFATHWLRLGTLTVSAA
ncbi:baseplate J/gp47 family protein [Acinetobacter bereziniae]|uniref:Baseplate J/gp47 family protein n=1 Tax=Acinetobacter bereziniae TaxID=106648 RepID=A0A8I1A9W9_ACIBZ|nr:baseplate J/gp47 family protein [Acinetobacter bereziniae]QQC82989.1 baseplate J/gp47 family protein [Acinetobacter bereziniae]UUN96137.1 baseplate J/gp47 family protein [Acinetobacter bereziniae]